MAFARTIKGSMRLAGEHGEFLLDESGADLPDALVEEIRGHVNISTEPIPRIEEAAPEEEAAPKRRGR